MLIGILLAAAAALGCLGPRVTVMRSGANVSAAPKPADCKLELFYTRVDRPYDEIAALHAQGGDTFKDGPDEFVEAIRSRACELGADAVVVTQGYSGRGGTMNAAAIRYRP